MPFLPFSFSVAPAYRRALEPSEDARLKAGATSNRLRQDFADRFGHTFDFRARNCFRDAEQAALGQVREVTSDRQWPDNFVPQQFRVHELHGTRKLDHEL